MNVNFFQNLKNNFLIMKVNISVDKLKKKKKRIRRDQ